MNKPDLFGLFVSLCVEQQEDSEKKQLNNGKLKFTPTAQQQQQHLPSFTHKQTKRTHLNGNRRDFSLIHSAMNAGTEDKEDRTQHEQKTQQQQQQQHIVFLNGTVINALAAVVAL